MANPRTIFLEGTESLSDQVAAALLAGIPSGPFDLEGTEVWTPTSGAARRIRHSLAKVSEGKGSGVLSPKFSKPMAALLPQSKGAGIASRSDREAAWGLVLNGAEPSSILRLFPKGEVLEGEQALLGTAGMLCDLCDMLAEGGITPLLPRILEVCEEDEDRWSEMVPLYKAYLGVLSSTKLTDPNEVRIHGVDAPAGSIKKLFIACIPDLPMAAQRRANALLEQGVPVTVLVWKPGTMAGGFDAWGRPIAQEWRESEIPLLANQIVMSKDPADEAERAIQFLSEAGGSHALVLGDPDLAPAFEAEILLRGGRPFLPEGETLSTTEAAVVASEWVSFRREKNLRTLRRLLEAPHFAEWIGKKSHLNREELFCGCDAMTLGLLAETLIQVTEEALVQSSDTSNAASWRAASKLHRAILGELSKEAVTVIKEAWANDPAGAEQVIEICEEIAASPVLKKWTDPQKVREAALVRALSRGKQFGASRDGDLDLSGWLEAPWAEAKRLALCGCIEKRLPASTDGHPFLPDQKRRELGITDNAARRARDAYLLCCLARSRGEGDFRVSFSKFGADGSPSVPSGLLLRCGAEELPVRVKSLFDKPKESAAPPRREHDWRWSLPKPEKPFTRINATDFSSYLECPFRFYLRRRLRLEAHDPDRREMDAMQFGTLVHKVLERYGRETPLLSDQSEIISVVLAHLEHEVRERFGEDPSPAVRVQAEAARVRLISFARVQAEQVSSGWKILEAERSFGSAEGESLLFAGFPLSAKIDRIEENGDTIRILDYKTQGTLKLPEEAHYRPGSRAFMEEAQAKGVSGNKAWGDLQLPLYSKIASILYPGRPVEAAYFVLAADPEESGVFPLSLNDVVLGSALECAEAVATSIKHGIFWPPRPLPSAYEDQFGIFLEGGKPEECLDPATISFLQGEGKATKKGESAR